MATSRAELAAADAAAAASKVDPVAEADGAWPPAASALRREAHFGDRVVRCFAQRHANVYTAFEQAARRFAAREALVYGTQRWSYAALERDVALAARRLQGQGIGRGDRVGLLLRNRPAFVITFWAIQRLGAIAVPIDVRLQGPEVAHVATTCGLALLLHEPSLHAAAATAAARQSGLVLLALPEDGWPAPSDGDDPAPPPGPPEDEEATALVLFTSGTTGRPKGAMLSHLNLVHSVLHHAGHLRLGAADRVLMALPLAHVSGVLCGIVAPHLVGATLVLLPAFKAEAFLAAARDEHMTYTLMVPAMYNLCLRVAGFDWTTLAHWRVGHFGGAPMPAASVAALRARLPALQLVNGYGATETCSPAAMMAPDRAACAPASAVGTPLPCAEILVVDPLSGVEQTSGEAGELWIRGPMVFSGYWGDPEATRRAIVGGFWRSGDIGSIDAQGLVHVHDRLKDLINRGGYKVYSAEVESVLMQAPGVIEAAVVARADPVLGERVQAFVHAAEPLDPAALAAFCRERLADYKVPEHWTFSAAPLPRNANGKLAKQSLREQPRPT